MAEAAPKDDTPPPPPTKEEALAALNAFSESITAHPGPKPQAEQWEAWGKTMRDFIDPPEPPAAAAKAKK